MKATKTLYLRIPPQLHQDLWMLADSEDRSINYYVAKVLEAHVKGLMPNTDTAPEPPTPQPSTPYKPPRSLDQYDAMWPNNPMRAAKLRAKAQEADNPVD